MCLRWCGDTPIPTSAGRVLPLLLRTVIALDPPHITLLVRIDQSVDRHGKTNVDRHGTTNDDGARRIRLDRLTADWPGPADLLGPLLAGLERENLAQAIHRFGGSPRWLSITDYGYRFLDYLSTRAAGRRSGSGPLSGPRSVPGECGRSACRRVATAASGAGAATVAIVTLTGPNARVSLSPVRTALRPSSPSH